MANYRGKQIKRTRADIATLTFHSWIGKLINRTKTPVGDKEKGLYMIEQIERHFDISQADKYEMRKKLKEKEEADFKEMEKEAKEKVEWTRDERGNISSPFARKSKWS